ncbi:MAG: hypothetical protein DCF32_06945, partial [Leptolyngbya sp.]
MTLAVGLSMIGLSGLESAIAQAPTDPSDPLDTQPIAQTAAPEPALIEPSNAETAAPTEPPADEAQVVENAGSDRRWRWLGL